MPSRIDASGQVLSIHAIARVHPGAESLGERLYPFFPPVDIDDFMPENTDGDGARLSYGFRPFFLLGALWAGARVRFAAFEPERVWGLLAEASVFMAVPTIYAKLVNASEADAPIQITVTGAGSLASTATALTLSADPQATNAIDTPERVVPVTSTVTGVESGFTYTVPKHGIVVLTMGTR